MTVTAAVIPRVLNIGASVAAPLANVSTEPIATTLIDGALSAGGLASSFGSYTLTGLGTSTILATSVLTGAVILLSLSACPTDPCPDGFNTNSSGSCVRAQPVVPTSVGNTITTRITTETTNTSAIYSVQNVGFGEPVVTRGPVSTVTNTSSLVASTTNLSFLDNVIGRITYDEIITQTPTKEYYTLTAPNSSTSRYYSGIDVSQIGRLTYGNPAVTSPSIELYRRRATVQPYYFTTNPITVYLPVQCSSITRVHHEFQIDSGSWNTLSDTRLDVMEPPDLLPRGSNASTPPDRTGTSIQVVITVILSLPSIQVGSVTATPGVSVSWVVAEFINPFPDNDTSSLAHKVVNKVISITSSRVGDTILASVPYAGAWLANAVDVRVSYRVVPR